MARIKCYFAKLHSSKPTTPGGTVPRPICRSIFVSSVITSSLLSIAVGNYITQTRRMRTLGDVIWWKASQKTSQTMILSPVIRQLMSPVLLTLSKMSLKSSQASKMSSNTSSTSKIQKYQKFKNFPHVGGSSIKLLRKLLHDVVMKQLNSESVT